jgi:hypothetical protein
MTARIENLTSSSAAGNYVMALPVRTDHSVELIAARLGAAPYWGSGVDPATWAYYVDDHVTTDTTGYGAGYGTFYADQWQGASYRIWGTVTDLPEGVLPSQVDIRLFRVSPATGVIENFPWARRTPDTAGDWSFDYLPTDSQFGIQSVPPAGLWPRFEGPYIPATE